MKRRVYRVKPNGKAVDGWRVEFEATWQMFTYKPAAVSRARRLARSWWEDKGEPTQLVVHGRDGRIQYEHTYGNDPRRRQG